MVFGSLDWYVMVTQTIDAIYHEELNRPSEALGNASWLFHAREEGWTADTIRNAIRQSPEWHAIHDFPVAPTREQVCGVKLSFQGLTVNTQQFGTVNWFEPWLSALTPADRQAVYAAKKAAGDKHVIVEFRKAGPIYDESPFEKFVSPDFEANPQAFRALVEEIIRAGFTPVVAFDGDNADNPVDGYPNARRQLPILVDLFKAGRDITPYILFARLWDGVFYGSTPENIAEFGRYFRSLLPNGYLAIEHNPGHIPVGNGPADWTASGSMATYDVLMSEFSNWPETGDQIWQVAARTIGSAYRRPIDQPSGDDPNPPFYLAGGNPRGPYFVVAFEFAEYDWVRSRISAIDVQAARNYFKSIGYSYVG